MIDIQLLDIYRTVETFTPLRSNVLQHMSCSRGSCNLALTIDQLISEHSTFRTYSLGIFV